MGRICRRCRYYKEIEKSKIPENINYKDHFDGFCFKIKYYVPNDVWCPDFEFREFISTSIKILRNLLNELDLRKIRKDIKNVIKILENGDPA